MEEIEYLEEYEEIVMPQLLHNGIEEFLPTNDPYDLFPVDTAFDEFIEEDPLCSVYRNDFQLETTETTLVKCNNDILLKTNSVETFTETLTDDVSQDNISIVQSEATPSTIISDNSVNHNIEYDLNEIDHTTYVNEQKSNIDNSGEIHNISELQSSIIYDNNVSTSSYITTERIGDARVEVLSCETLEKSVFLNDTSLNLKQQNYLTTIPNKKTIDIGVPVPTTAIKSDYIRSTHSSNNMNTNVPLLCSTISPSISSNKFQEKFQNSIHINKEKLNSTLSKTMTSPKLVATNLKNYSKKLSKIYKNDDFYPQILALNSSFKNQNYSDKFKSFFLNKVNNNLKIFKQLKQTTTNKNNSDAHSAGSGDVIVAVRASPLTRNTSSLMNFYQANKYSLDNKNKQPVKENSNEKNISKNLKVSEEQESDNDQITKVKNVHQASRKNLTKENLRFNVSNRRHSSHKIPLKHSETKSTNSAVASKFSKSMDSLSRCSHNNKKSLKLDKLNTNIILAKNISLKTGKPKSVASLKSADYYKDCTSNKFRNMMKSKFCKSVENIKKKDNLKEIEDNDLKATSIGSYKNTDCKKFKNSISVKELLTDNNKKLSERYDYNKNIENENTLSGQTNKSKSQTITDILKSPKQLRVVLSRTSELEISSPKNIHKFNNKLNNLENPNISILKSSTNDEKQNESEDSIKYTGDTDPLELGDKESLVHFQYLDETTNDPLENTKSNKKFKKLSTPININEINNSKTTKNCDSLYEKTDKSSKNNIKKSKAPSNIRRSTSINLNEVVYMENIEKCNETESNKNQNTSNTLNSSKIKYDKKNKCDESVNTSNICPMDRKKRITSCNKSSTESRTFNLKEDYSSSNLNIKSLSEDKVKNNLATETIISNNVTDILAHILENNNSTTIEDVPIGKLFKLGEQNRSKASPSNLDAIKKLKTNTINEATEIQNDDKKEAEPVIERKNDEEDKFVEGVYCNLNKDRGTALQLPNITKQKTTKDKKSNTKCEESCKVNNDNISNNENELEKDNNIKVGGKDDKKITNIIQNSNNGIERIINNAQEHNNKYNLSCGKQNNEIAHNDINKLTSGKSDNEISNKNKYLTKKGIKNIENCEKITEVVSNIDKIIDISETLNNDKNNLPVFLKSQENTDNITDNKDTHDISKTEKRLKRELRLLKIDNRLPGVFIEPTMIRTSRSRSNRSTGDNLIQVTADNPAAKIIRRRQSNILQITRKEYDRVVSEKRSVAAATVINALIPSEQEKKKIVNISGNIKHKMKPCKIVLERLNLLSGQTPKSLNTTANLQYIEKNNFNEKPKTDADITSSIFVQNEKSLTISSKTKKRKLNVIDNITIEPKVKKKCDDNIVHQKLNIERLSKENELIISSENIPKTNVTLKNHSVTDKLNKMKQSNIAEIVITSNEDPLVDISQKSGQTKMIPLKTKESNKYNYSSSKLKKHISTPKLNLLNSNGEVQDNDKIVNTQKQSMDNLSDNITMDNLSHNITEVESTKFKRKLRGSPQIDDGKKQKLSSPNGNKVMHETINSKAEDKDKEEDKQLKLVNKVASLAPIKTTVQSKKNSKPQIFIAAPENLSRRRISEPNVVEKINVKTKATNNLDFSIESWFQEPPLNLNDQTNNFTKPTKSSNVLVMTPTTNTIQTTTVRAPPRTETYSWPTSISATRLQTTSSHLETSSVQSQGAGAIPSYSLRTAPSTFHIPNKKSINIPAHIVVQTKFLTREQYLSRVTKIPSAPSTSKSNLFQSSNCKTTKERNSTEILEKISDLLETQIDTEVRRKIQDFTENKIAEDRLRSERLTNIKKMAFTDDINLQILVFLQNYFFNTPTIPTPDRGKNTKNRFFLDNQVLTNSPNITARSNEDFSFRKIRLPVQNKNKNHNNNKNNSYKKSLPISTQLNKNSETNQKKVISGLINVQETFNKKSTSTTKTISSSGVRSDTNIFSPGNNKSLNVLFLNAINNTCEVPLTNEPESILPDDNQTIALPLLETEIKEENTEELIIS